MFKKVNTQNSESEGEGNREQENKVNIKEHKDVKKC